MEGFFCNRSMSRSSSIFHLLPDSKVGQQRQLKVDSGIAFLFLGIGVRLPDTYLVFPLPSSFALHVFSCLGFGILFLWLSHLDKVGTSALQF